MARTIVDLHDRGVRRQEISVRKIRPEQEEQVALCQRLMRPAPSEQTCHPDCVGVARFQDVLGAVRIADGGTEQARELQHLSSCVAAAFASEDHGAARSLNALRQRVEADVQRTDLGSALRQGTIVGRTFDLHHADIPRHDNHPNAALKDRGLEGERGQPRHLAWRGDVTDVSRAIREDQLGRRFLKVVGTDLGAWNVGNDREHRRAVPVTVI
jgi:hypothetical protein